MSGDVWSIVLIASLMGWVASMLGFIFRAFPARSMFDARMGRMWGSAALIFFGIWIAGLLNA